MAAPVPLPYTVSGVRVWLAESVADLQAMDTATRGPQGEVLRVNDEGWVFGAGVAGGSNISGVPAVYTCSVVGALGSTWVGKAILIPGIVYMVAGLYSYAVITGTSLDINGAADISGILTVGGQVNAKLRECKAVRRTAASTAKRFFNIDGDGDGSNGLGTANTWIAPADGQVTRVTIRPTTAGGSTVVGVDVEGSQEDKDTKATSAGTVAHFDFTTATFSKGDRVSVSTNPATIMGECPGQVVFEYDWSTA